MQTMTLNGTDRARIYSLLPHTLHFAFNGDDSFFCGKNKKCEEVAPFAIPAADSAKQLDDDELESACRWRRKAAERCTHPNFEKQQERDAVPL